MKAKGYVQISQVPSNAGLKSINLWSSFEEDYYIFNPEPSFILICDIIFSHTLKSSSQSNSLCDLNFSQCFRIVELHLPCYSKSSKDWSQSVFPNVVSYCISVILCSKSPELFALHYPHPTLSHLILFTLLKLLLFPDLTSS